MQHAWHMKCPFPERDALCVCAFDAIDLDALSHHVASAHLGPLVGRSAMLDGELIRLESEEAFKWLAAYKTELRLNMGWGDTADAAFLPEFERDEIYVVQDVWAVTVLPCRTVVASIIGADRAEFESRRVEMSQQDERLGYKTRASKAFAQIAAILADLEVGDPLGPACWPG